MAKTNQVIENPIMGDRVKFLVTSKDSQGKVLKVELYCKPGAQGPPLHYHPLQTEKFEVIKGSLGLDDKGKSMVLKAGDSYQVERNSRHRFYNASDKEEVLVEVTLEPALKTEFFFETMYALAKQGKTNANALPKNPLQFAAIMHEYDGEMLAEEIPLAAQKFMAKGLGRMAKLLGFKGYIPFK